ncbi:uncharacterized protein PHACADRAFT_30207 [Phanerochaete carnosa HHB-10118-sp]|uniref:Uncharacterized protein n=1 Tax=Phanerochaete carnosa (strain HHB-10118-sp) TaxID=650164 RepID=K5W2L4_PHACS|nr:uncharacterized protein PHACADRAFT_30207 [Phanerochaete carnosa HHB-10118-sp]EKM53164.1 hypothetical protein PHACADRAFT_30207 [Phanerochaete carnosa HHB-10118-sp]
MSLQNKAVLEHAKNLLNVLPHQSKMRAECYTAKSERAGNSGHFHGETLAYLSQYIKRYNDIDKMVKEKNMRQGKFWHDVGARFWKVVTIAEAKESMSGAAGLLDDDIVNTTNEQYYYTKHSDWVTEKYNCHSGSVTANRLKVCNKITCNLFDTLLRDKKVAFEKEYTAKFEAENGQVGAEFRHGKYGKCGSIF